MTEQEFAALQRGDIVRNSRGESYVVLSSLGRGKFTAIREICLTNSAEWEISLEQIFRSPVSHNGHKQDAAAP